MVWGQKGGLAKVDDYVEIFLEMKRMLNASIKQYKT